MKKKSITSRLYSVIDAFDYAKVKIKVIDGEVYMVDTTTGNHYLLVYNDNDANGIVYRGNSVDEFPPALDFTLIAEKSAV